MNRLKIIGASLIVAEKLTNAEWILIISIIVTILGMIQDYLKNRE